VTSAALASAARGGDARRWNRPRKHRGMCLLRDCTLQVLNRDVGLGCQAEPGGVAVAACRHTLKLCAALHAIASGSLAKVVFDSKTLSGHAQQTQAEMMTGGSSQLLRLTFRYESPRARESARTPPTRHVLPALDAAAGLYWEYMLVQEHIKQWHPLLLQVDQLFVRATLQLTHVADQRHFGIWVRPLNALALCLPAHMRSEFVVAAHHCCTCPTEAQRWHRQRG